MITYNILNMGMQICFFVLAFEFTYVPLPPLRINVIQTSIKPIHLKKLRNIAPYIR